MKPSCICTFATDSCIYDLKLFLLSMNISNPDTNVVVFVDDTTKAAVDGLDLSSLKIEVVSNLNRYSGKNRQQMEMNGTWSDFQMVKSQIIQHCLEKFPDVLFLDSDIFIINPIEIPDDAHTYDIGLSPHYIKKSDTDKYGYYNGGVVWTNNKSLPSAWRDYTKRSRYFDQASLEDCARQFKTFTFPEHYNVSWWRLTQSTESYDTITSYFSHDETNVYYKKKPIAFVHTHFTNSNLNYFNFIVKAYLRKTTKHQLITLLTM